LLSSKGIGKFKGFGDKQIKAFQFDILENIPTGGGGISAMSFGKKYENGREKGEKCKEKEEWRRKGRKRKEKQRKGKERGKKKEEKRKENGRKKGKKNRKGEKRQKGEVEG
jgi:hypothetical protein